MWGAGGVTSIKYLMFNVNFSLGSCYNQSYCVTSQALADPRAVLSGRTDLVPTTAAAKQKQGKGGALIAAPRLPAAALASAQLPSQSETNIISVHAQHHRQLHIPPAQVHATLALARRYGMVYAHKMSESAYVPLPNSDHAQHYTPLLLQLRSTQQHCWKKHRAAA